MSILNSRSLLSIFFFGLVALISCGPPPSQSVSVVSEMQVQGCWVPADGNSSKTELCFGKDAAALEKSTSVYDFKALNLLDYPVFQGVFEISNGDQVGEDKNLLRLSPTNMNSDVPVQWICSKISMNSDGSIALTPFEKTSNTDSCRDYKSSSKSVSNWMKKK